MTQKGDAKYKSTPLFGIFTAAAVGKEAPQRQHHGFPQLWPSSEIHPNETVSERELQGNPKTATS